MSTWSIYYLVCPDRQCTSASNNNCSKMKRVQVGVVSTSATRPYITGGEGRGEGLSKSNRNKLAEKLPALDPAFLHLGSSGGGEGGKGNQQQADFIYELAIFLPNQLSSSQTCDCVEQVRSQARLCPPNLIPDSEPALSD